MTEVILTKDFSNGENPTITLKVGDVEKVITEQQAKYIEVLNDKGLPELVKAILEGINFEIK